MPKTSTQGFGAALLQNDRPIAFASRTLKKSENMYAPIHNKPQPALHASVSGKTIPTPPQTWDIISIDHLTITEHNYILVLIDEYNRFVQHHYTFNMGVQSTISLLNTIFFLLGFSNVIKSDNAPTFISKLFATFYKTFNIQHYKVSPYNLQGNGIIECFNRTIREAIRIFNDKPIQDIINSVQYVHNFSHNFGHNTSQEEQHTNILISGRRDLLLYIKHQMIPKNSSFKNDFVHLPIGVVVYKRNLAAHKNDQQYIGAYKITEHLHGDSYMIVNITNFHRHTGIPEIANARILKMAPKIIQQQFLEQQQRASTEIQPTTTLVNDQIINKRQCGRPKKNIIQETRKRGRLHKYPQQQSNPLPTATKPTRGRPCNFPPLNLPTETSTVSANSPIIKRGRVDPALQSTETSDQSKPLSTAVNYDLNDRTLADQAYSTMLIPESSSVLSVQGRDTAGTQFISAARPYEEGLMSISKFIRRFEELLDADRITHDHRNHTYEELKKLLLEKYSEEISETTALNRLKYLKLDWSDSGFVASLTDYGNLLKATAYELSPDHLLNFQINNVATFVSREDELYNCLINKTNHSTFSELVQDLYALLMARRQMRNARTRRNNVNYSQKNHKFNSSNGKTMCTWCGYLNHTKANCFKKRNEKPKTFKSKNFQNNFFEKLNHYVDSSINNPISVNSMNKRESINGLLGVVLLDIDDHLTSTLIDSGATIFTIKLSTAKAFNLKVMESFANIISACDLVIKDKAEVINNSQMDPVDDLIVGTSTLRKLEQINFNFDKNSVTIQKFKFFSCSIITQQPKIVSNIMKLYNPDINFNVKEEFSQLEKVSSTNKYDIGQCDIQVPKQTFLDKPPPPLKRYLIPPAILKTAKAEIVNLVNTGVLSPATNCKYLHNVLFVKKPKDDLLIATLNNINLHITVIKEILTSLFNHGLKISSDKCIFLSKKVRFLGFIISENGVQSDNETVKIIKNLPIPKTLRRLRSFVRVVGFFNQFFPRYSVIMAPLFNLFKKEVKFNWDENAKNAFIKVKEELALDLFLAYFNSDLSLVVFTNASQLGYSGILCQK
uniref:Integrase catalytic domain-containing protein n=1 Tax=Strongyloides stercoralis TaxID=6248 RepID=A0A0K0E4Y9_STRER